MELDVLRGRRLALARAGLLKPEWTGAPAGRPRGAKAARAAALEVVRRFGYLQLDTVSIAGARSHALVLMSRLDGIDPELGETLLGPGAELFEYWGHEASWIPLELYPVFAFRRQDYGEHPWWGDVVGNNPEVAARLRARLREEGPLRSADMEGQGGRGWWDLKVAKKVADALWLGGEVAIRERVRFQRAFDLTERVIPDAVRELVVPRDDAIERLLLLALQGHGWAASGTLAQTFRLKNMQAELRAAMERLIEKGAAVRCHLVAEDGTKKAGFIRPEDLELAERLARVRPTMERAVLLSPFDPVLWDRARVQQLFGFEQVLEIFKPAPQRKYGYFCLPVLAGEHLVARYDLKAEKAAGRLRVLAAHFEPVRGAKAAGARALQRHAEALGLEVDG
ncbi:MAG: YcaQ family DNA glycosylase [Deltaproteobacteria bacterium]|nr:YcaQ family DNA glycosylase [Deltaproteobacteria bacterium]